ncbi:unnamed protein product [Brugia timori]|uniref:Uncharacterized protein n=1 Tax=Brugia timori TaxID=42155 RepID=A0A3P7W8V4_9BILA|nr:unnamed protein product [Brugia timori]
MNLKRPISGFCHQISSAYFVHPRKPPKFCTLNDFESL